MNIKELEKAINEFCIVKGSYYITITEIDYGENIIFSIYDAEAEELILDLIVMRNESIYETTMMLKEALKLKYSAEVYNNNGLEKHFEKVQINIICNFYEKFIWILEMISEQLSSYDDSCS